MSAHLPVGAEDLTKAPALAEDLSKAIAGRSPNMQEPQEEFVQSCGTLGHPRTLASSGCHG